MPKAILELLPCPFCGNTATLYHTNDNHHSPYIQCDGAIQTNGAPSCYATIYPWKYKTDAEAIAAWNRRVQQENNPLTLNEMNHLNHEPIYIKHTSGKWRLDGWHIATSSSYTNHGVCNLEIDNGNQIIGMDNYGKTWFAYRFEPKEVEHLRI